MHKHICIYITNIRIFRFIFCLACIQLLYILYKVLFPPYSFDLKKIVESTEYLNFSTKNFPKFSKKFFLSIFLFRFYLFIFLFFLDFFLEFLDKLRIKIKLVIFSEKLCIVGTLWREERTGKIPLGP